MYYLNYSTIIEKFPKISDAKISNETV